MKVAVIQMVSTPDVSENLLCAERWIAQASEEGAELLVLPEYFCGMGMQDTDKLTWSEPRGQGMIQHALAHWAAKYAVWLVGGTVPIQTRDARRVYNTSMVFDPQGACIAAYDKIHLFRFSHGVENFDEAAVIQAGTAPVSVDITDRSGQVWRLGLSVCYDLRFPELYRIYAAQGAHILLAPSAFTYTTGQAHWELLLRARAVENQCWVLAAAQGGRHVNGRQTWGHSMVVDPWGSVLAEQATAGAGISYAVLDAAFLQQVRQRLPALEHRCL